MKRALVWFVLLATVVGLVGCAGGGSEGVGTTAATTTEPAPDPLTVADLSVVYDETSTPNSIKEIVRLLCETVKDEWGSEPKVNPQAPTRCQIKVSQADTLALNSYAVKAMAGENSLTVTVQGDNRRSLAYAVQQLRLFAEEKTFEELSVVNISGDLGIDMPKKISIYGDSISTYYGISDSALYNTTLTQNVTYYNVERMTRNDMLMTKDETWWGIVLSELDAKLCVNNSYMGDATTSQYALGRAANLHKNFMNKIENPDTIIVYFGINDYHAKAESTFRDNYRAIIAKMQETYPDARIYCCTLLAGHAYKGARLAPFNADIRAVARALEVNLIDLDATIGADFERDMADLMIDKDLLHPNKDGMKRMGAAVAEAIREWYYGE